MAEDEILDRPEEISRSAKRRPLIITILCVLGFLGCIGSLPTFLTIHLPLWYKLFLVIVVLLTCISFVGLLKMKKWAAFLYIGTVLIELVCLIFMGHLNFTNTIVTWVYILVIATHIKSMD